MMARQVPPRLGHGPQVKVTVVSAETVAVRMAKAKNAIILLYEIISADLKY